jgi:hypothetical protein
MDNTGLTGDEISEIAGLGLARNDLRLNKRGFDNMIPGQFISV